MPLSDVAVRTLRPRERAYKVYDHDGLFLRVNPSGSKLWRWLYRFDQKEKLMALGEYPAVTLVEARDHPLAAHKLLAGGRRSDGRTEGRGQTEGNGGSRTGIGKQV